MKHIEIKNQIYNELKSAKIKSAEIDAGILIEFVSKKSPEFLLTHPEFLLKSREVKKILNLVALRKTGTPIAYLTNKKEFFGFDFYVDERVLIPRPETEILVEKGLKFLKKLNTKTKTESLNVLDVGTGSGCIIISLATNCQLPTTIFTASDISSQALKVAKKNAKKHKAKIKFIKSDLFENIPKKYYDIILANLPYVPLGGSNDKEIKFEPQKAIFAEDNGSKIIKKFLIESKKYLRENGKIFIELDPRNANDILKFAKKVYKKSSLEKDYSGLNRYLTIQN